MQDIQQEIPQELNLNDNLRKLTNLFMQSAAEINTISNKKPLNEISYSIRCIRREINEALEAFMASAEAWRTPGSKSVPFTVEGRDMHFALATLSKMVTEPPCKTNRWTREMLKSWTKLKSGVQQAQKELGVVPFDVRRPVAPPAMETEVKPRKAKKKNKMMKRIKEEVL